MKKTGLVFGFAVAVCADSDPESGFLVSSNDIDRDMVITKYAGSNQNVKIPSVINGFPVTQIGESAFLGMDLISVVIPDSVVTVWSNAFANNKLTEVTIGNGVM